MFFGVITRLDPPAGQPESLRHLNALRRGEGPGNPVTLAFKTNEGRVITGFPLSRE
jgi:hypothetical protein